MSSEASRRPARAAEPAGPGAGRRADARRNIAAIVDAGLDCLTRDPDASVADIAQAANLGRITVYGHFAKRADLVEAVFEHAITQADEHLEAAQRAADPTRALTEVVASSWRIIARLRNLLIAAQRELPEELIRRHHDRPLRRVRDIIQQGRRDGVFRDDLPIDWLVAVAYSTLHTAAEEVAAGRLAEKDVGRVVTATVLAAFRPPAA